MRPIVWALTLGVFSLLIPGGAPAQPRQEQPQQNTYQRPQLDALTLIFAVHRMNGAVPDFRPYAEHSRTYQNATAFVREQILERELVRLRQEYDKFDLGRIYTARVNVPLGQYDMSRKGYPVEFSESSYLPYSDPVTYDQYGVAFGNRDNIAFIPMAPADAERFASNFNLQTRFQQAGRAVLQLDFRLNNTPANIGSGPTMVHATIVSARLMTQTGRVMHDFGNFQSQIQAAVPGPAVLKAADVQGFRVGMSAADADQLGVKGWETRLGTPAVGAVLFFNGLKASKNGYAVCASVFNGSQDSDERGEGKGPPSFRDCAAYTLVRDGRAYGSTVETVVTQQALDGVDQQTLRRALDEKYGRTIHIRNEGDNRVWIGRDPIRSDDPDVQIEASIQTPRGRSSSTLLTVTVKPYHDARSPQPAPAVPASPKL